jgi:hypothetical protein
MELLDGEDGLVVEVVVLDPVPDDDLAEVDVVVVVLPPAVEGLLVDVVFDVEVVGVLLEPAAGEFEDVVEAVDVPDLEESVLLEVEVVLAGVVEPEDGDALAVVLPELDFEPADLGDTVLLVVVVVLAAGFEPEDDDALAEGVVLVSPEVDLVVVNLVLSDYNFLPAG